MLFSQLACENFSNHKRLTITFVDVRKAYFNGRPTRPLFVRLPVELGPPPSNIVGKLERRMDDTEDAGYVWESCDSDALISTGFVQGSASPCGFHHPTWDVQVVVHGDDFTGLGNGGGSNFLKTPWPPTSK